MKTVYPPQSLRGGGGGGGGGGYKYDLLIPPQGVVGVCNDSIFAFMVRCAQFPLKAGILYPSREIITCMRWSVGRGNF